MTNPQAEEYLQARLESCKLLGFDPNNLTPHEAIRADVVTVLRLSLDASQGQLLAGGNADPAKVLAIAEALLKAIPEREPKADHDDPNYDWTNDPNDPRYQLKEAWRRDVEAARADERESAAQEIAQLKDENAQLRDHVAQLTANPKMLEAPKPVEGEIIPPGPTAAEREAKRQAINNDRSEFYRQGLRPAGTEAWRPHTWRFE